MLSCSTSAERRSSLHPLTERGWHGSGGVHSKKVSPCERLRGDHRVGSTTHCSPLATGQLQNQGKAMKGGALYVIVSAEEVFFVVKRVI